MVEKCAGVPYVALAQHVSMYESGLPFGKPEG